MLLYFLLYDGTHSCIVGEERERTKENSVGLDFSISIENWLKHNCTRDTHYFLHSVCAFFCIFSCCCCLFIFPFFSVVGFPFHPQFFFSDAPSSFFLPFILLILLLVFLKPHSFFLHKSAFHPSETVRSSCMGHILNQLYFTSAR